MFQTQKKKEQGTLDVAISGKMKNTFRSQVLACAYNMENNFSQEDNSK